MEPINQRLTNRLESYKESEDNKPLQQRVMPPLLAEILKTFPLREPDRSVDGENCDWLLEWHFGGERYFEIEYTPEGRIEIMTQFNGEIKHWVLKGV